MPRTPRTPTRPRKSVLSRTCYAITPPSNTGALTVRTIAVADLIAAVREDGILFGAPVGPRHPAYVRNTLDKLEETGYLVYDADREFVTITDRALAKYRSIYRQINRITFTSDDERYDAMCVLLRAEFGPMSAKTRAQLAKELHAANNQVDEQKRLTDEARLENAALRSQLEKLTKAKENDPLIVNDADGHVSQSNQTMAPEQAYITPVSQRRSRSISYSPPSSPSPSYREPGPSRTPKEKQLEEDHEREIAGFQQKFKEYNDTIRTLRYQYMASESARLGLLRMFKALEEAHADALEKLEEKEVELSLMNGRFVELGRCWREQKETIANMQAAREAFNQIMNAQTLQPSEDLLSSLAIATDQL